MTINTDLRARPPDPHRANPGDQCTSVPSRQRPARQPRIHVTLHFTRGLPASTHGEIQTNRSPRARVPSLDFPKSTVRANRALDSVAA
jgi:hypothetical protein